MALIQAIETITTPSTFATKSVLLLYGSNDAINFTPVAGISDYRVKIDKIKPSRFGGVYKYFTISYAGRVENTVINNADARFTERYMNRER